MTRISLFFAIYSFYPTIEFNIKDNIPEGEVLAIAEYIELIKREY
jgi:hypothetical protein